MIDLLGDTYHYLNIRRYDMDADSWSSFPYPAGYPATGLAMPDIVSMLQHTGQNVCYISGGATTWGGGDTSTLYAYYPDTQTVVNLGDYTLHPDGLAWHSSWWVPWFGAQGGICVAGGTDANWSYVADSQCYDLATGTFDAPDADLRPLPEPWWGGADAWRINEAGQYEIWGYQGMGTGDYLLQKSFVSTGSSFAYGPVPLYPVFRMEGDNFDGSVWVANDLTGWLYPVTLQEVSAVPGLRQQTMHVATSWATSTWTPTGARCCARGGGARRDGQPDGGHSGGRLDLVAGGRALFADAHDQAYGLGHLPLGLERPRRLGVVCRQPGQTGLHVRPGRQRRAGVRELEQLSGKAWQACQTCQAFAKRSWPSGEVRSPGFNAKARWVTASTSGLTVLHSLDRPVECHPVASVSHESSYMDEPGRDMPTAWTHHQNVSEQLQDMDAFPPANE